MLLMMAAVFMVSVAATTYYSFTVRYHNKDSRSWTFKAKMSGSIYKVTFGSSRTSSVSFQGSGSKAVVTCECGDVEVESGDRLEIKKGCIKVK